MLIKVHSFIDVITNSSTEIYVCADEGTVKSIKELVGAMLVIAGSDKTPDDLFDFNLVDVNLEDAKSDYIGYKIRNELDSEIPAFSKMEWKDRSKLQDERWEEYNSSVKTAVWFNNPTTQDDWDDWYSDNYGYGGRNIQVEVTPKNDTKESRLVAKTLSSLTSLFDIDSAYNG